MCLGSASHGPLQALLESLLDDVEEDEEAAGWGVVQDDTSSQGQGRGPMEVPPLQGPANASGSDRGANSSGCNGTWWHAATTERAGVIGVGRQDGQLASSVDISDTVEDSMFADWGGLHLPVLAARDTSASNNRAAAGMISPRPAAFCV
jgi:hypothetical protein